MEGQRFAIEGFEREMHDAVNHRRRQQETTAAEHCGARVEEKTGELIETGFCSVWGGCLTSWCSITRGWLFRFLACPAFRTLAPTGWWCACQDESLSTLLVLLSSLAVLIIGVTLGLADAWLHSRMYRSTSDSASVASNMAR